MRPAPARDNTHHAALLSTTVHASTTRRSVCFLWPENQYQHYHLRQRPHNKALIPKTYLIDRDYIMRMLYKNTLLAYCYTLLQYCYVLVFAILETFVLLTVSLLLCVYII